MLLFFISFLLSAATVEHGGTLYNYIFVYLLFITRNLPVFTVDVTPASVMYALTM